MPTKRMRYFRDENNLLTNFDIYDENNDCILRVNDHNIGMFNFLYLPDGLTFEINDNILDQLLMISIRDDFGIAKIIKTDNLWGKNEKCWCLCFSNDETEIVESIRPIIIIDQQIIIIDNIEINDKYFINSIDEYLENKKIINLDKIIRDNFYNYEIRIGIESNNIYDLSYSNYKSGDIVHMKENKDLQYVTIAKITINDIGLNQYSYSDVDITDKQFDLIKGRLEEIKLNLPLIFDIVHLIDYE